MSTAEMTDSIENIVEEIHSEAWKFQGSAPMSKLNEWADRLSELRLATATPASGETLDRPARVAGRDFMAGELVQQVVGRAHAHYDAHHSQPTASSSGEAGERATADRAIIENLRVAFALKDAAFKMVRGAALELEARAEAAETKLAELIEADKALDMARANLSFAMERGKCIEPMEFAVAVAEEHFAAALARCRGAA